MKKINLFFLLLASFLCTRCIDEISLDIDKGQTRLVVDGLLSDSLRVCTIQVRNSAIFGVGKDNILTPIGGAEVSVTDDGGTNFPFLETSPGIYTHEMKGEAGKSYQLEVKTPDGKTIMSNMELLRKAPAITGVSTKVENVPFVSGTGTFFETQILTLNMSTVSTGEAQRYLHWRTEAEYEFKELYPMAINTKRCFVKNNVELNNIAVYDAADFEGGNITEQQVLATGYDHRFGDMFCFHLFQYCIGEAEYNYWKSVDAIVNIDGSLFDPPPGTVRSNLYVVGEPKTQVHGYFSVAGVAYKREFVNPQTTGIFVERKCHGLSFRPQYSECMECLEIANSTVEVPQYWP